MVTETAVKRFKRFKENNPNYFNEKHKEYREAKKKLRIKEAYEKMFKEKIE